MRVALLIAAVLCAAFTQQASGRDLSAEQATRLERDVSDLKRDNKVLQESVEILRRDQVNYRTEKELLKDAFTSNLQTINLVITIILGVFAFLGYLGLRNIAAIKAEYTKELEELKTLRTRIEAEFQTVITEQRAVKEELLKVVGTNEEQDKRLKVLEIQEKVGQLLEAKSYQLALDYADAGLGVDPRSIRLLMYKFVAQMRIGQLEPALETQKRVLEIESSNQMAIENAAELLLLVPRLEEYERFFGQHETVLVQSRDGALAVYLKILECMQRSELRGIKDVLIPFLEKSGSGSAPRLGTWGFDEVRLILNRKPTSEAKSLMIKIIDFFQGTLAVETLRPLIDAL